MTDDIDAASDDRAADSETPDSNADRTESGPPPADTDAVRTGAGPEATDRTSADPNPADGSRPTTTAHLPDPDGPLAAADPADRIVLESVAKRYGSTTALADVSLATRPGSIHGLIGPNGSGKTTLFRLIAGLANPTDGRLERPAGGVGYSFQEPRFFPALSVRENLSVFRSLEAEPEPQAWVETLLSELRLEPVERRRAGELSGGFRKKLDLALALLSRPQVLLLDEPLADVDRYSRRKIRSFLAAYADADRTILVSSHNGDEFADLYDRITILVDGELRADGPPDDDRVMEYREYYG